METAFETQFHRVDLRWAHEATARTRLESAVTLGLDRTDAGNDLIEVVDKMAVARVNLAHQASDTTQFRSGFDVTLDRFSLERATTDPDEEEFNRLFPTRTDLATGAWTDVVIDADPQVTVTPGIRADLYTSEGASAVGVDPRIAALYRVGRRVRLVHTLGIAHQPPVFPIPIPGFQLSSLEDGLQRSLQSSAGVEVDLPSDWSASATLFQNAFFGMTDFIGSGDFERTSQGGPIPQPPTAGGPPVEPSTNDEARLLLNRSLGSAVGLELKLERSLSKRFGGFLSYTLSRSVRSMGREHVPAAFDRTHVANVAVGYDLGKRWRTGSRVTFYTGRPSSQPGIDGLRPRHPRRLPAFFRLDLRLEKQWPLGDGGYWAFVVEMLNSTLSREVLEEDCDTEGCRNEVIGPVSVPMIAVEALF